MKERAAALLIGLLMIGSMAGFAMVNVIPQRSQQQLPSIITRPLTTQEKVFVLRTGRVLIEDFYSPNCTECYELNQLLTSFVKQYESYAVLNMAPGNETRIRMIGAGGSIRDIPTNATRNELMDIFCEIAIYQPKECLLAEI